MRFLITDCTPLILMLLLVLCTFWGTSQSILINNVTFAPLCIPDNYYVTAGKKNNLTGSTAGADLSLYQGQHQLWLKIDIAFHTKTMQTVISQQSLPLPPTSVSTIAIRTLVSNSIAVY